MHWQSEKNLLSSNISSTCSHNMVNFGTLVSWSLTSHFSTDMAISETSTNCYKTVVTCAIVAYCMQLYSTRRPSGAKTIACIFRIWAGLSLSISVWLLTSYPKRRVTVIITWFHQRLSLAATLWPHEYFRTCTKACNYCTQQLQRAACNKLHM